MRARPGIRVLAGTADGLHVLGGRTAPRLIGHEVRSIVVTPAGWWCIVDRRHIYARRRGSRWKRLATLDAAEALCLARAGDAAWIGTAGAGLWRLTAERLAEVESFAGHRSRVHWFTPWGGPPDTRSIAVSTGGTVFVNVHVGGILRSDDHGASWQDTLDLKADAHQVLVDPDRPRSVYAATARGFASSDDAGGKWRFETGGMHAHYQRAVAICSDRVLVSVARNERGRDAALYGRPRDRAIDWVKCTQGLPRTFDKNIDTHCLAGLGDTAAFGTTAGDVFVSTDQGLHWERLGEGLPPIHALALARR